MPDIHLLAGVQTFTAYIAFAFVRRVILRYKTRDIIYKTVSQASESQVGRGEDVGGGVKHI